MEDVLLNLKTLRLKEWKIKRFTSW